MSYETDTPTMRYQRDPAFKQLVDMIQHMLHAAQFTPSELREAVMLAAINYEMLRVRRPSFDMDESDRRALWSDLGNIHQRFEDATKKREI